MFETITYKLIAVAVAIPHMPLCNIKMVNFNPIKV
jgi:hypothetical protein